MSELFKILIRAPKEREQAVSTYPLIHQLKEEYPNSQVHILHDKGAGILYKVFPFETFTYEYNEDDESLPAIHKYAVNQNDIFNIDLFFDLVGGFKSSFLGFSFKAKERVGYVNGFNKLLLTHKVEPFESYRRDKVHLKLFESYKERDLSSLRICGKEKSELLKTIDAVELAKLPDYFFIHSSSILKQPEFWNDFFRFFEDQYFLIWFEPDDGEQAFDDLVRYFKEMEEKNVYLIKTGPEDQFLKLLVHAIAYITEKIEWAYVADYLGIKTYVMLEKASDLPFLEHFERSPTIVEMANGLPSKWICSDTSEAMETVDSFVNRIHDIHKL